MLDFSKAFDNVGHQLLLTKLGTLNFPNWFISWISSYLSSRSQLVKYDNVLSSPITVRSGVPQGSILGPYLFNVFIADLLPCTTFAKIVKYADDVTIICCAPKRLFYDIIKDEVANVVKWASYNQININFNKSSVIPFGSRSSKFDLSHFNLNVVDSIKLLGVIFDSQLNWTQHINSIYKKQCAKLYLLRTLRNSLSTPQLFSVYTACIASLADYASTVFIGLDKTNENKLERIHKRAHKIICGRCSNQGCPFWRSVAERRSGAALILFKKILASPFHPLHHFLPPKLKYSGHFRKSVHRLNLSSNSFINYMCSFYNNNFSLFS
jgi:hypothetical protein